jgi:hypothetical protein
MADVGFKRNLGIRIRFIGHCIYLAWRRAQRQVAYIMVSHWSESTMAQETRATKWCLLQLEQATAARVTDMMTDREAARLDRLIENTKAKAMGVLKKRGARGYDGKYYAMPKDLGRWVIVEAIGGGARFVDKDGREYFRSDLKLGSKFSGEGW